MILKQTIFHFSFGGYVARLTQVLELTFIVCKIIVWFFKMVTPFIKAELTAAVTSLGCTEGNKYFKDQYCLGNNNCWLITYFPLHGHLIFKCASLSPKI